MSAGDPPFCRCMYPPGNVVGFLPPPPVGCICPPTSEQTCGNPICPRKPLAKAEGKP